MRSSILSRSVIGVAALGIGSVALAAAPATAATPSGITRDQVLTAAAGVRSGPVGTGSFIGNNYGPTANRALKAMANRACGIDPDGNDVAVAAVAAATAAGGSADGVVVTAIVFSLDPANTSSGSPQSLCTFAALATTAERSVLSGTATVSARTPKCGCPTGFSLGSSALTRAARARPIRSVSAPPGWAFGLMKLM